MKYTSSGSRRKRVSISICALLLVCATFTGFGILMFAIRSISIDPSTSTNIQIPLKHLTIREVNRSGIELEVPIHENGGSRSTKCATVEEMGKIYEGGFEKESLRVRKLIQHHFALHGASRVRGLPPEQFCRQGFVIAKASEAGFGNEMYKILSAAALSIMLNRSLIIGQTRGKYPFGNYISYANHSFTLREVKHLWNHNGCLRTYGRHLVVRIDNFLKPAQSSVLCGNWREWEQPVIWFQGTTDAVAAQFFLKSIHPEMRSAASDLFGLPENLQSRPNVFGELMRVLIYPSEDVREAVNWVLKNGLDVDISLHMRMLMNRSVRAIHASLDCIRKAIGNLQLVSRPRMVLVSDTPSLVKDITPSISEFAEVVHFEYKVFKGNLSDQANKLHNLDFRAKDWGPAPRWVAFVDFFLASRAKHAVISGAQRRVGTTYAQLIAALAAANSLGENSTGSGFTFLSSFQSNLLSEGLGIQVGWGHVWNRYAGPLSCHNQSNQCAPTPLLPPAWWDGLWQSPIPRDIRKLEAYGIHLSGFGTFDETHLQSFCSSRKNVVTTVPISQIVIHTALVFHDVERRWFTVDEDSYMPMPWKHSLEEVFFSENCQAP